jgi:hypothetical protein
MIEILQTERYRIDKLEQPDKPRYGFASLTLTYRVSFERATFCFPSEELARAGALEVCRIQDEPHATQCKCKRVKRWRGRGFFYCAPRAGECQCSRGCARPLGEVDQQTNECNGRGWDMAVSRWWRAVFKLSAYWYGRYGVGALTAPGWIASRKRKDAA